MVCLPTITTAALFTAIIIYDLYDRNWSRIPGHGLFGVFATLLILFICQRTSDWVAWSILAIPIVFSLLAYFFMYKPSKTESSTAVVDMPCDGCNQDPCGCNRPPRKPRRKPKHIPVIIDPPKFPDHDADDKSDDKSDDKPKDAKPKDVKHCKPSSASNWGHGGFYIKTTYE